MSPEVRYIRLPCANEAAAEAFAEHLRTLTAEPPRPANTENQDAPEAKKAPAAEIKLDGRSVLLPTTLSPGLNLEMAADWAFSNGLTRGVELMLAAHDATAGRRSTSMTARRDGFTGVCVTGPELAEMALNAYRNLATRSLLDRTIAAADADSPEYERLINVLAKRCELLLDIDDAVRLRQVLTEMRLGAGRAGASTYSRRSA